MLSVTGSNLRLRAGICQSLTLSVCHPERTGLFALRRGLESKAPLSRFGNSRIRDPPTSRVHSGPNGRATLRMTLSFKDATLSGVYPALSDSAPADDARRSVPTPRILLLPPEPSLTHA